MLPVLNDASHGINVCAALSVPVCRLTLSTVFLAQLLLAIGFLLSEVLLQTSLLATPYKWAIQMALPDIYADPSEVELHPYFASGLLFVAVTTLVLFFASGMYSEKIAYANRYVFLALTFESTSRSHGDLRYVPHANKALRSFNMYLNVRTPPLRSKFRFNPLSLLFPRPSPAQPPSSPTRPVTRGSTISSIPHTTNPRGELIFSSRVDRSFRDSYERYRSAFERKRDERQRLAAAETWWGWFMLKMPWSEGLPSPPVGGPNSHVRSLSASFRGRGTSSLGTTPSTSRRSSPAPRANRQSVPRIGTPQRPPPSPDRVRTRSMDL